jgi:hypothetical protein
VAHADGPEAFIFVRLAGTERGTLIRDSVSSGGIRVNRGAHVTIEDNVLRRIGDQGPAVGVAVDRWDSYARIVGNELNYVDVFAASADIIDNDIAGATLPVPMSQATSSFREGVCGVSAPLAGTVLIDNRIHGNETGVCGQPQIDGGEIYGNGVGVWSARYWGHGQMMGAAVTHIEGVAIKGNQVGVRTAPLSTTVLHDVELCANSVAAEPGMEAELERSGSTGCGAP